MVTVFGIICCILLIISKIVKNNIKTYMITSCFINVNIIKQKHKIPLPINNRFQ